MEFPFAFFLPDRFSGTQFEERSLCLFLESAQMNVLFRSFRDLCCMRAGYSLFRQGRMISSDPLGGGHAGTLMTAG